MLFTTAFAAALSVAGALADAPAAGWHIFLLTGQSNSLGAVKGSPAPPELLEKYRSEAKMWNGNMVRDTGVCFEKNPGWQAVEPQLPRYNGNNCMGPEYGFCHILERRAPKVFKGKLGIIKASLDGGGNHFWMKGGKAYASMTASIAAAMKAQKGGVIEGLIYLQGESNAGEEVTLAGKRFAELAGNLKKDIPAPKLRFFVVGEPATWHGKDTMVNNTTTVAELAKMVTARKNTAWVRTRDLTKITQGDSMGVHYDGKSQITIGARFGYNVLMLMRVKEWRGIRNDNPDAPLESPEAWWNCSAKPASREPVVAVWDVAAANTEETLSGKLLVAGIRIEDPFRAEIIINGKDKNRLFLGEKGIVLQDADLRLNGVKLDLSLPQTWEIPAGRTLTLHDTVLSGAAVGQLSLQGEGTIVLSGTSSALDFPVVGKVTIRKVESLDISKSPH